MRDDNSLKSDLYAIIGQAVAEFIREERSFKTHDISLSLHAIKSASTDEELRHLCDTAMRLLADLMH